MSVKVGKTSLRPRKESVHSRFHSTPDFALNSQLLKFPAFVEQKPKPPTSKEVLSTLQQYTDEENKSEEVLQIQSKLAEWIGSKRTVSLSQFLDLIRTIAPHIASKDATELFHHIDTAKNGEISTNILHQFLPQIISKVFIVHDAAVSVTPDTEVADAYNGEYDANDDHYKGMNTKQLIGEIKKLNKWITKCGEPGLEKVLELEGIVSIYENERNSQAHEIYVLKEQISARTDEPRFSKSLSNSLLGDNQELLQKIEDSDIQWQQQKGDMRAKDKEIERYKKLGKQMRTLNDKYFAKNEKLSAQNHNLQEELNDLRERMLWFETDAMQRQQEDLMEIENLKKTLEALTNDLETKNVETVTKYDSNNDLQNIRRIPTLSMVGRNQSHGRVHSRLQTLTNWYGHALARPPSSDADDPMDDSVNMQVFEDAMMHEVKKELTEEIKTELQEDFELQLQRKEIESKLYVYSEKQKAENEKRDLVAKYEGLIQQYQMELDDTMRIHEDDRKDSLSEASGVSSYHECEADDGSAKGCIKKKWSIIDLFGKTTLMWSLPMIK